MVGFERLPSMTYLHSALRCHLPLRRQPCPLTKCKLSELRRAINVARLRRATNTIRVYDNDRLTHFRLRVPQNPWRRLSRDEISAVLDSFLSTIHNHKGCEDALNEFLGALKNETGYSAGKITNIIEAFRTSEDKNWGQACDLCDFQRRETVGLLERTAELSVRCLQSSYPADESNLEPNANDQQYFRQQSAAGLVVRCGG